MKSPNIDIDKIFSDYKSKLPEVNHTENEDVKMRNEILYRASLETNPEYSKMKKNIINSSFKSMFEKIIHFISGHSLSFGFSTALVVILALTTLFVFKSGMNPSNTEMVQIKPNVNQNQPNKTIEGKGELVQEKQNLEFPIQQPIIKIFESNLSLSNNVLPDKYLKKLSRLLIESKISINNANDNHIITNWIDGIDNKSQKIAGRIIIKKENNNLNKVSVTMKFEYKVSNNKSDINIESLFKNLSEKTKSF